MSVDKLIIARDIDEPGSVTYWTRGKGNDFKIFAKRPLLGSVSPVTCRIDRQEIAEACIKLVDPEHTREFQVRLRCDARIQTDMVEALIRARAHHSSIDMAICNVARNALDGWRGPGSFIDQLFPPGEKQANRHAVDAVSNSLTQIGLKTEKVRIEPLGWNTDERVPLSLGPRNINCSGESGTVSVTISGELIPDSGHMAAFLTSREASAGASSIRNVVESHIFDWLDRRYSRHHLSYEAQRILSELQAELDKFCGKRFGRSAKKLSIENPDMKSVGPEPEAFEFAEEYSIAASNDKMRMTHRGTIIVTDVGRAPNGLAQRRAEAEQRIKTAIQSHILAFSASKVLSVLHTFADENANALSQWVSENDDLKAELAARGLKLITFYVFTNEQLQVPAAQGRSYPHTTAYPISGTDRVLTLRHNLYWQIGPDKAQKAAYVEFGSPEPEIFESEFLGKEIDAQTSRRLLPKTFDAIIFDYFKDRKNTESRLTTDLQNELSSYARIYGVELMSMTTVLEMLPEARLLTGETIDVDRRHYSLADFHQTIELSAKVKVILAKDGDASLLRDHLSGDDSSAIFTKLKTGIAEQIEFILVGIEPWEILSFRDSQMESIAIDHYEHDAHGAAIPTFNRIRHRVAEWLLSNFGLEIVETDGFRLPRGACALIEARDQLPSHGGIVKVEADTHVEWFSAEVGVDVPAVVELTIPFKIVDVGSSKEDRIRFVRTLRSMNSVEAIVFEIESIIHTTVSGLIQIMSADIFTGRGFEKFPYAQAFALLCVESVRKSLGVKISILHGQIIPNRKCLFISNQLASLQKSLSDLIMQREKARTDIDGYDSLRVKIIDDRIFEAKTEIEKITKFFGPHGESSDSLDHKSVQHVEKYLTNRGIDTKLLTELVDSNRTQQTNTSDGEIVADAEYEEIDSGECSDNEIRQQ